MNRLVARAFALAGIVPTAACAAPGGAHKGHAHKAAVSAPLTETPDSRPGAGDAGRPSSPGPATTEATTTTTEVVRVSTTQPNRTSTAVTVAPFVLPEDRSEPDEFDARDAATARVSWYGAESGSHTANGDRYDPSGLTFAHRSMAFGTRVRFCGPLGCVVATCTDRGPAAWTGKLFDLSRAAFASVAPLSAGVATVTWEVVG